MSYRKFFAAVIVTVTLVSPMLVFGRAWQRSCGVCPRGQEVERCRASQRVRVRGALCCPAPLIRPRCDRFDGFWQHPDATDNIGLQIAQASDCSLSGDYLRAGEAHTILSGRAQISSAQYTMLKTCENGQAGRYPVELRVIDRRNDGRPTRVMVVVGQSDNPQCNPIQRSFHLVRTRP